MECVSAPGGATVSYVRYGSGPALVLVHGGFSDHQTNWQEVAGLLAEQFTVYAVARRGRGLTSATVGHSVEDESADVMAVLREIGEPVYLLGHSYGALCALGAGALHPAGVRELVLYEPPHSDILAPEIMTALEAFAGREDWDGMVGAFMRDVLQVPVNEIEEMRGTPFWSVWTADARASLNDLRAVTNYRFDATRYRSLEMPVLLLIGSESPREIYLTDALSAMLPNARIREFEGQAHEAMTTAPELFVETITESLFAAAHR